MGMKITRRSAMAILAGAYPALAQKQLEGTRESLKTYQVPQWFQDAKFGIWAHWGPQSAPEDGDWYARNMYMEGSPQYKFHLDRYGPQSKMGFKDVVETFKAERWDPVHLMDLYQKAGAKYFVSMGVHHDNFDMWNSKFQPRWNAAASGPKKDIVGIWKREARKRGMRFGVSEHLSNSFDWLAPAHLSDKSGPYAGVPYDGADPKFADLYHDYSGMPEGFANSAKAMGRDAPDRWKQQYFNRIKDLIDQHEPDLLYTDGGIPFDKYGLDLVAHVYNVSARTHGGKVEAVYNSKVRTDCAEGTCALDLERGIVDKIWPAPWQTDTCIGGWHYKKGIKYKSTKTVIDMLVDIVSRNGNLLLNFPLPGSGELDSEELAILAGITEWMAANGEGIYATRPWKVYGTGPSTKVVAQPGVRFNENGRKTLTAEDVRFTAKGNAVYAFVMGWPAGDAVVEALGTKSESNPGKVRDVRLLGHGGKLEWTQGEQGLTVKMPANRVSEIAVGLKVMMA
jgi:alpha-L-fucosidase